MALPPARKLLSIIALRSFRPSNSHIDEYRQYLKTTMGGRKMLKSSSRAVLVLVSGLPAAGKTTLVKSLSEMDHPGNRRYDQILL
ncbi:putative Type II/IV secretion system protein [Plasmopara halstedii]